MLFKGRLRLPSDPGEGIPIDLELEDVYLSLDSDGEDFGEWRLDTVEIKRLFSNQFSMLLDGEEMVFIADDALGFAYDGLSAIEDVQSRLSKRRVFKGRKPKKRKLTVATDAADEAEDEEIEEAPPEPTRPDIPMPEVVPFFPEKSPSFADSVAESAIEDDSIAPVAPRPIAPDRPADVPVEPVKAPEPTPAAQDSPPTPQEAAPTPSPSQPPPVSPAAAQQPTPAVPAHEPAEAEEDDEFVIEEVAAYGYVPNMTSAVPTDQANEPEPTEETFEIEEADVATGAVHRQVQPLGEPEPGSVQRAPEVHPLGEPEPEPESKFEAPPAPEPEPEPEPAAATPEPVAPAAPATNDSGFGQWSSNGRSAPQPQPEPEDTDSDPDRPQTQRSGRHERSSTKSRSLFGRKKSREPEAHEHRYESSKTVGGITRSVCAVCGHVSFAGEDVYQDW